MERQFALACVIGLGIGVAVSRSRRKRPQHIVLTYFDLPCMPGTPQHEAQNGQAMGAPGEKIRLALALAGIPYTDKRVPFSEWAALKPKLKYTTVPVLDVDGRRLHQSSAILHWVGQLGDGSLYPVHDRELCRRIEEVMGLGDDLHRAWAPAMMLGMGLHPLFGFPLIWPEQRSVMKGLRQQFVKDKLPRFMLYIANELEESGGGAFLCGQRPTIADCQLYSQVVYFTRGAAEHVPTDCLLPWPSVIAWLRRFEAIPEVAEHLARTGLPRL